MHSSCVFLMGIGVPKITKQNKTADKAINLGPAIFCHSLNGTVIASSKPRIRSMTRAAWTIWIQHWKSNYHFRQWELEIVIDLICFFLWFSLLSNSDVLYIFGKDKSPGVDQFADCPWHLRWNRRRPTGSSNRGCLANFWTAMVAW